MWGVGGGRGLGCVWCELGSIRVVLTCYGMVHRVIGCSVTHTTSHISTQCVGMVALVARLTSPSS